MFLTHLVLRNFRNYSHAEISLSPSINVILGDNGQGKTNLLEAIYLLSTGRSFRSRHLSDLIYAGERFFYIEAHFQKEGVPQTIKVYYDEKTRKVQYNNTIYPHLTSLLGILPGVLLSPDDHGLITGGPSERRRFLDLHIAQMDPLYIHHLARYFRALKQRNCLLKEKNTLSLNAWEEMMAHSGSYLIAAREAAITSLIEPLEKWMELLSGGKESLSLSYSSPPGRSPDELTTHWRKTRTREMQIGSTLTGPHRDDLEIFLSKKEAKSFSSEGQKRCATASLRIAEWQRFKQGAGSSPLLGIDDFGLQLDAKRLMQLQKQLHGFDQVFLTSPQELALDVFEQPVQCFRIEKGSLLV